MRAAWIPERYPPSGTIGAAGFYKLLGRPQLDPLTVLVRETAQNSWDAKRKKSQSVKFAMHGRELTSEERSFLVSSMLPFGELAVGTGLDLMPDSCTALFVVDRGTVGLGGPVSASEVSSDKIYDWVDFVLNVGKANTAGHTGGTYGFGKTIAYVVSSVNTVVVYSRAKHEGALQSRLIACAIGSEFDKDGALFTGRHWWGAELGDAPRPLLGVEADAFASGLGIPAFEGDDTGTTLMIVQPDFGGRSPEQGMRFIVEAALWNLWPKLVALPNSKAEMTASFSWNGKKIPLPSPESRPPLGGFVQAFQGLLSEASSEDQPPGFHLDAIGLEKPRKVVGALATLPMAYRDRVAVEDGSSTTNSDAPASAALIVGPSHHVALLRSPNLVVEYLEGPPSPEGSFEWAGVFKAEPAEDHAFAMAEPPTHDTWRPDLINDRAHKSVVKMALQNIRRTLEDRWGSRSLATAAPSTSTSAIALGLAHLVAGSVGTAPSRQEAAERGGSGTKRPMARLQVLSSGPIEHETERRTQISVLVLPASGSSKTQLDASIGIALSGGGTDQNLDPGLKFLFARVGDEITILDGTSASLLIEGVEEARVDLVARRTEDLSIAFDLQVSNSTGGIQ